MSLYEYFEEIILYAIKDEKDTDMMPANFDVSAEDYGWHIKDRATGEKLDIILERS